MKDSEPNSHIQTVSVERLDILESRLSTLTRLLDDMVSAQRSMQETIRQQRASRSHPVGPPPVDPRADTGIADFGEWVIWMVQTYELLLEWPPCWYRHRGFVEELRALYEFHSGIHAQLAEDPRAGFGWHDAFWRFRGRAMNSVKCSRSGHSEPTPSVAATNEVAVAMLRANYQRLVSAPSSASERGPSQA